MVKFLHYGAGTASLSGGAIVLKGIHDGPAYGALCTKLIDLTDYDKLVIKMSSSHQDTENGYIALNAAENVGKSIATLRTLNNSFGTTTLEYDISSYKRQASIVVAVYGGNALTSTATIYEIYLK